MTDLEPQEWDMSDFDYWFDGIVGTCRLIADNDAFTRTWVLGDHSITSIHYYDALFEQLVSDLHLDESVQRFAGVLKRAGALEAFLTFAQALHKLDGQIEESEELQNPSALLRSQQWLDLQLAAKRVIDLPVARSRIEPQCS